MPSATLAPIFKQGYHPGHIGRIVELHGTYYSKHWGSGATFEILMAAELAEFCERYDPERDLLLTAHVDNKLIGSIAVHGSDADDGTVRLRWFIVDEAYHGQGIGRALLEQALMFCREKACRTYICGRLMNCRKPGTCMKTLAFGLLSRCVIPVTGSCY